MDSLNSLIYGFSVALQPENLLYCFIGSVLGTLVGVLPGIGPVGAISILLPITFKISATGSIIMLAGLYYGAMYGGSTTSILVNIPGEAASVITCMDGHQMALKGRAGPALGMAAFGSFIAGTVGIVGLMLFAKPLSRFALDFGPHEYFALIILGLTFVTYLSHGSMLKSVMMACLGLMLSNIGLDPITSSPRMTFGILELFDGIGIAPVAMGLFGIGEVLVNLEQVVTQEVITTKLKNLFPSKLDWIESKWALVRGTLVGFFPRYSAGRRTCARLIHVVRPGKETFEGSEEIRNRSYRGHRRSRVSQQLCGFFLLHPASDARNPAEREPVGFVRCVSHPWCHARAAPSKRASGSLLGRGKQHVPGERYAAGIESSFDPDVGSGPEDSGKAPLSAYSAFLPGRRLQHE